MGLVEQSRRPRSSPLTTGEEIVVSILELRDRRSTWRPNKIARVLGRKFGEDAPSKSTVARVLLRLGKTRRRRPRIRLWTVNVAAILARIVRRAAKVLVGFDDDIESEADALAALQATEVDRRLRNPEPFEQIRRSALIDGFSLHAGVRVHANDRDGLARLCRYLLRPPLALHRLSRGDDGGLLYRMKRPRHGSS